MYLLVVWFPPFVSDCHFRLLQSFDWHKSCQSTWEGFKTKHDCIDLKYFKPKCDFRWCFKWSSQVLSRLQTVNFCYNSILSSEFNTFDNLFTALSDLLDPWWEFGIFTDLKNIQKAFFSFVANKWSNEGFTINYNFFTSRVLSFYLTANRIYR